MFSFIFKSRDSVIKLRRLSIFPYINLTLYRITFYNMIEGVITMNEYIIITY